VPHLSVPTVEVAESFRAAMAEFAAEGRGAPDDESMIGWEIRAFGPTWDDDVAFADFVRVLLEQADEDAPRPAHLVPCTTWWWVDGREYLGRIALRHRLSEHLREVGGHIGYDVRPSARGRGHATAMLAAVLPRAAAIGIDPALVTCDVDNVASRRVIEHAGGELEDERHGKLRYWVPTAAARG
jgi:predicted acetyltransferase